MARRNDNYRKWPRILQWEMIAAALMLEPLHSGGQSPPKDAGSQVNSGVAQHLQQLQRLQTNKLFEAYTTAADEGFQSSYKKSMTKDHVLTEIVRRADPASERFLMEQLALRAKAVEKKRKEDEVEAKKQEEGERTQDSKIQRAAQVIIVGEWARNDENLELLTALCRLQKIRDPLTVQVSFPKDHRYTTRDLPTFHVALTNVDEQKRPIWIKHGGDYRSGRAARFRLEVTDAKGDILPQRARRGSMGGGLYSEGPLAPGESSRAVLPMGNFVKTTTPGEYIVRVLYHNRQSIADADDVLGLILCDSEPFKVTIAKAAKTVIPLEAGATERSKPLIAALSEQGIIRIVAGKYDASFHDFVDPKSPEGQLLTLRWQAVPGLLNALQDETLSFHKRGWVLALLYVITEEEDLTPFSSNGAPTLVPGYAYRSVGCSTYVGGSRPDVKNQKELAKQWLHFAEENWDFRTK